MWGAFGVVPMDDPPAPGGARGQGRGTDAGPPPQPMGPDGAPQFVPPVHAVKVSTDGLVYVADRGGRRVQVFTIAGKFVNQVFIGRECHAPDCGNGQTAAGLAFSPDPEQRYLYVANRSQAQIMIFNRKTLETYQCAENDVKFRIPLRRPYALWRAENNRNGGTR